MTDPVLYAMLALVVGTLGAIVYSLRVLVIMERRVSRIEEHIESIVQRVLKDEEAELSILRKKKRRK